MYLKDFDVHQIQLFLNTYDYIYKIIFKLNGGLFNEVF